MVVKVNQRLLVALFICLSGLFLLWLPSKELLTPDAMKTVIWDLRVPRLILLICVGGSLSILGAIYQILFSNPLAEPYVLGVSSAVSLAVASLSVLAWVGPVSPIGIGAGTAAALVTSLLLAVLSMRYHSRMMERLVLFGMAMNFVLSALLFLFLSYMSQALGGGSMQWLFGRVPWLTIHQALFLAVTTLCFLSIFFVKARELDILSLGPEVARTMGVNPNRTRIFFIILTSLFIGVLVSEVGSVGFVGLVVPHVAQLLLSPASSRSHFVGCFFIGSIYLVAGDLLSRNILPPVEFPIGIMTTLIGAPLFLWLLWKR